MKKALIADDTKNIRNLLTTCLELNDYTVLTAKNGMEAIELIEKESFDIAFLDVKMPLLSGTEVLKRIRSIGHNYPVVIMTAYATVKNAVECTKLGAIAYLQKPFKVDKVNDILSTLDTSTGNEESLQHLIFDSTQLMNNDNDKEALKLLHTALSIDPSCGEVYKLIGKIHEKNSEAELAIKFYNTAGIFNN